MRHPGEQRYAVVSPYAAKWLLAKLHAAGVTRATARTDAVYYRERCGDLGRFYAMQVEAAWLQLESAAADHVAPAAVRRERPPEPVADDGNASAATGRDGAGLQQQSDMTTKEAAMRLGVKDRRVRQLVDEGVLTARKVGRSWLVERGSVEAAADTRAVLRGRERGA